MKPLDDTHYTDPNEKWFLRFKKVFKLIHNMEKGKYLDPKFALTLFPLMKFLMSKYKH